MKQSSFKHRSYRGSVTAALALTLLVGCNKSGTKRSAGGTDSDTAVAPVQKKSAPAVVLKSNDSAPTTTSGVILTSSAVPHQVATSADPRALGQFAWQQFVALNWPTDFTATTPVRGVASKKATFLNTPAVAASGAVIQSQPTVWQTYKHRVETFPMDESKFVSTFDGVPKYSYTGVAQSTFNSGGAPVSVPAGKVFPLSQEGVNTSGTALSALSTTADDTTAFALLNNLDETSEINLCTLFVSPDPNAPPVLGDYMNAPSKAGAARRFIYQAKGNKDFFQYIKDNDFYKVAERWKAAQTGYVDVTQKNMGGIPPKKSGERIYFPAGSKDGPEGAILIKATWRPLTAVEASSGRFLIAPVTRYFNYNLEHGKNEVPDNFGYQIVPPTPTANTQPYGLVGLHIIHKTTNYPTLVFATFEQVDNLNDDLPDNKLFLYDVQGDSKRQSVQRSKAIDSATQTLNAQVHADIRSANSQSVWQYYKLIGVQGHATSNAEGETYFLSNIVTETNFTLQEFSGGLSAQGTKIPTRKNIYHGDKSFVGGGCKGCHGNSQAGVLPTKYDLAQGVPKQAGSFDFSFTTANAPFDGHPDAVNQPLFFIP